ncbi:MAG: hypothetical protein BroJett030_01740 [Alphaproteobacteria bacterium]|nr:MAG: hypothetical protein BroJett030_01740 [Alphaproteobacteria bacterium]
MAEAARKRDKNLYERDFYAWTQDQAAKLRARAHNDIDWENAAEEIESLGRSDKREIRTRMGVLIKHLLKWKYQPARRSESWLATISEQRANIQAVIADSPSLRQFPADVLDWAWAWGVRDAAREAGLPPGDLPASPEFSVDEVLDDAFLPGEPWTA